MAREPLLQRALGAAGKEVPADAMSERILDAAVEVVAASGLRHLTMDDVAARAGVGRMTVYRRFGDRDHLIDALTIREARRCLAEIDATVDPGAPVDEQIAQGLLTSLRLIRDHPVLDRFARYEPDRALEALNQDGAAIFAISRAFVAERIRDAKRQGMIGDVEPDYVAEILIRLGFSFLLMPATALPVQDDRAMREFARETIAPMLTATGS
jgi:TetR/AcrR family transcriptional regulator, repressor for uid operon